MNNEEPIRVINENQQVSTKSSVIPEQSNLPKTTMPRQISILNWIYQWQPMGIRVILNLPFTGDDSDYVFAIRNGPFVPYPYFNGYEDLNLDGVKSNYDRPISSFGYNNTRAVYLPYAEGSDYPNPAKPTHTMVHYDLPPIISTMAQSFRRWRGDMQYRLRIIAGFATQGYVIATSIKNTFSPIAIYDEYTVSPHIERQDISYRAGMMNAYALSDTSMFRHLELTMPYDYPTPYYDQYAWLSRRICPSVNFQYVDNKWKALPGFIQDEPHGDNYLAIGIRGNLEAGAAGSQIIFELEYRCAEGFQFADPFFPPTHSIDPMQTSPDLERVIIIPNNIWTSNGITIPVKKKNEVQRSVDEQRMTTARIRHHKNHIYRTQSNQDEHQTRNALERLRLASMPLGQSSRNG
ncbi:putative capsid protein [Colobopsis shohki virus 1]|nr:putative capsid protein [Colobopsis shohki virus 1]